VLDGFVSIHSDRDQSTVFEHPLSLEQALARIQSWFDQPCMREIRPTEQHWTTFQRVLIDGQAVANLVTDAHIAALALEHGCTVASTDADFTRFPRLKWINPLHSFGEEIGFVGLGGV
jgi:toxin-antitoxin system PIN domain toxin